MALAPHVEFALVGYADQVAQALVAAALAELGERYGGEGDETPVNPVQFAPPHGAFFVAYQSGDSVGCGGWRTFEDDPEAAEIKRMYVEPSARRQGIALGLLRAIEGSARAAGRTRMILETGDQQPEAISLYVKAGYERIPDFGYYRGEPGVRSFGRRL
jgi:GNAT superfamily N-acetyltransferase